MGDGPIPQNITQRVIDAPGIKGVSLMMDKGFIIILQKLISASATSEDIVDAANAYVKEKKTKKIMTKAKTKKRKVKMKKDNSYWSGWGSENQGSPR